MNVRLYALSGVWVRRLPNGGVGVRLGCRDFEANLEVDFSYAVPGLARFRVN